MAEEIIEQPKKKRGRPKKVDPYAEFNESIINTFKEYINTYKDLLYGFINNSERINKSEWELIYNHVKEINNILGKDYPEYTYKQSSKWKLLDDIHEKMRKEHIKFIIEENAIEEPLKSWLVFNHLSVYIAESSAQLK